MKLTGKHERQERVFAVRNLLIFIHARSCVIDQLIMLKLREQAARLTIAVSNRTMVSWRGRVTQRAKPGRESSYP